MTAISLRQRALNYLSRREYAYEELYQKLLPYAEDKDSVNALLQEFVAKNWQSDARFVQSVIHSKKSQYGRLRLMEYLRQKGLNPDDYQDELPNDEDELLRAHANLIKKFKTIEADRQLKGKYMRFLLYRGFSSRVAFQAIDLALEEADMAEDRP